MPPAPPVQRAVPVVTGWADAVVLALSGALNDLVAFLPRLLGALLILLVGAGLPERPGADTGAGAA